MGLAKAEAEEALKAIVGRMENMQLAGEPEFDGAFGFWGFRKLPITGANHVECRSRSAPAQALKG